MSKKDYIKIAETLASIFNDVRKGNGWDEFTITHEFSLMLKKDNPNFDQQKFADYIVSKLI